MTALSIAVLAISIAQVSMMFNMIDSVLWSKVPYDGGERLVRILRINPDDRFVDENIPFDTYHALKRKIKTDRNIPFNTNRELANRQELFDGMIALFYDRANIQQGLENTQENVAYITTDFLKILGRDVLLGRTFTPEDAEVGADPVIIISKMVWEDFFDGRKDIIGHEILADGKMRKIIGVTPESFDFPMICQLWIPLNTETLVDEVGWGSSLFVAGKLKEGVDIEHAEEEMSHLYLNISNDFPNENIGYKYVKLVWYKELFIGRETQILFGSMGVCALLVLFMGCAIVSNLTTVRCVRRSNELAIRTALGASQYQIIIQMLFEAFILGAISFVLGWLSMDWFSDVILKKYYSQFNVPTWFFDAGINYKHIYFVVSIILFVTITSTLIPAIRASRTSINDLLKDSTRTGSSAKISPLGRILIIFQIAAACAVVTGAAIVGYYLEDVRHAETHFDKDDYIYAQLGMDANTHKNAETRINLLKDVRNVARKLPNVEDMVYSTQYYTGSLVNALRKPLGVSEKKGNVLHSPSLTHSHPHHSHTESLKFRRWVVSPGFFDLMNYKILAGRDFTDQDDEFHEEVVILTDVVAKVLFGDEDPLGKKLIYSEDSDFVVTVIGIVENTFVSEFHTELTGGFFRSVYQDVWFDMGMHLKMRDNRLSHQIEHELKRAVGKIDPIAIVRAVSTIRERERSYMLQFDFIFVVFMTFAIGALIMSGAGLFGVISFSISQMKREIGIRLALGADPLKIVLKVFFQGMAYVWVGIFLGVIMAYILRILLMRIMTPFFESLYVYFGVLILILIVATISLLIPSISGGRTDPADALRID